MRILRFAWLAAAFWTLVVGGSFGWNLFHEQRQAMATARQEAVTVYNKDITFRRWATEHGGVYVPLTEKQPSVPWLSHVPGRDVTTTDGRQLTLLNPASMLRQIIDRYEEQYGVKGRITGLRWLNPANAPDAWEKTQLEAFTRGEMDETWAEVNIDSKPYLRYLRAMYMDEGCEKCHAILGYKTGDMRGATGVNLPLDKYHQQIAAIRTNLAVSHGAIWLLGLAGIGFTARGMRRGERQLQILNDELEARVTARTTELARISQQALENQHAAERANAAKSEFLSRMSHELRTPLNAIIGFGQMLALPGKTPLTEQQADNVQEILKAGHHLLGQVNEVLDLARIDSGHIEFSLEPVGVADVLANCLALVRPLVDKRKIAIDTAVAATLAVQADQTRLKQVLLNLLSNAIKYNRDGGTIHVAAVPEGTGLRIAVRDTGRGIAAEKLASLFTPFERLESSYDGIEGTGIGLALVKRLVEAMGGGVGVASEAEVGSTFWFTLPATSLPAMPEQKVGAGETAPITSQPDKTRQCVLIIEDNPANLKLVRKMLGTRPDLILLDAINAELGLQVARSQHPDLILLDINLPGMDGFAALGELQADPTTRRIPVIALTANAMKRDIERGKAAGFADYLTKPLDIGTLLAAIDRYLPRSSGLATRLNSG